LAAHADRLGALTGKEGCSFGHVRTCSLWSPRRPRGEQCQMRCYSAISTIVRPM
jgi:hypothetical protein